MTMTNLIDRWISLAHNKANEVTATAASGVMVADSMTVTFTLNDLSTILGMLYIISMLIPRLYELVKWIIRKCKK
jgi:hypothetical protein